MSSGVLQGRVVNNPYNSHDNSQGCSQVWVQRYDSETVSTGNFQLAVGVKLSAGEAVRENVSSVMILKYIKLNWKMISQNKITF